MQEVPSTSTRSLVHAVRFSRSGVWRILREHDMHQFYMQHVQALQPHDYAPGIAFAQWYLGKCARDALFPTKVLFSDAASFRKEGIFNTVIPTCGRRRTCMQYDVLLHRLDFRSIFVPVLLVITSLALLKRFFTDGHFSLWCFCVHQRFRKAFPPPHCYMISSC